MSFKRNDEVKYNHFYFVDENVVLIGVNKDIGEEEASIFVDSPLQVYDDFAGDIVELKNVKDRKVLFDAVDDFTAKRKFFHGVYWDIFLDFLLSEKNKTLYEISVELSHIIPGDYEAKSIYDTLEKLKKSKGNPQAETLKLVKLICYYMGVTKEIVETGKGFWFIFEDKESYTLESIYQYCEEKRNQGQEIILKKMIKEITGLKYREIFSVPIKIWVKERVIDEKTKQFMGSLIKQMKKKGRKNSLPPKKPKK